MGGREREDERGREGGGFRWGNAAKRKPPGGGARGWGWGGGRECPEGEKEFGMLWGGPMRNRRRAGQGKDLIWVWAIKFTMAVGWALEVEREQVGGAAMQLTASDSHCAVWARVAIGWTRGGDGAVGKVMARLTLLSSERVKDMRNSTAGLRR